MFRDGFLPQDTSGGAGRRNIDFILWQQRELRFFRGGNSKEKDAF